MYFTDKHGISRGLQEVFHGTSPWMCCQFGTFLEVLSSAFLIRLCRRTIPTTSRIRCFDKTRHLTNTMSYRVNIGFWHVLRLSEADRDYDPVKDTGWQNSTNQNRFGRTLPLISWRWTTKKLHSQYATISHVEEFRKKIVKVSSQRVGGRPHFLWSLQAQFGSQFVKGFQETDSTLTRAVITITVMFHRLWSKWVPASWHARAKSKSDRWTKYGEMVRRTIERQPPSTFETPSNANSVRTCLDACSQPV